VAAPAEGGATTSAEPVFNDADVTFAGPTRPTWDGGCECS
jgi:hypothetical protein